MSQRHSTTAGILLIQPACEKNNSMQVVVLLSAKCVTEGRNVTLLIRCFNFIYLQLFEGLSRVTSFCQFKADRRQSFVTI